MGEQYSTSTASSGRWPLGDIKGVWSAVGGCPSQREAVVGMGVAGSRVGHESGSEESRIHLFEESHRTSRVDPQVIIVIFINHCYNILGIHWVIHRHNFIQMPHPYILWVRIPITHGYKISPNVAHAHCVRVGYPRVPIAIEKTAIPKIHHNIQPCMGKCFPFNYSTYIQ